MANHWSNFITLADWMHWLVSHFSFLMHQFWSYVASIIGITISKEISRILTFLLFYLSLTLGTIILESGKLNNTNYSIILSEFITPVIYVSFAWLSIWLVASYVKLPLFFLGYLIKLYLGHFMYLMLGFVLLLVSIDLIRYTPDRATRILLLIFLILNVDVFLAAKDILIRNSEDLSDALPMLLAVPSIIIAVAILVPAMLVPPKSLRRRLTFLLIGVVIIFGLSEASKLVENLRASATSMETH